MDGRGEAGTAPSEIQRCVAGDPFLGVDVLSCLTSHGPLSFSNNDPNCDLNASRVSLQLSQMVSLVCFVNFVQLRSLDLLRGPGTSCCTAAELPWTA